MAVFQSEAWRAFWVAYLTFCRTLSAIQLPPDQNWRESVR
jgi:hypothetical protein